VDVVISNCVVNLSPDKAAVLRETFRVLKPGGRIGISDVVAEDRLTESDRAARGDWAGCIAGALSRGEYLRLLVDTGFGDVEVADPPRRHATGDRVRRRRRTPLASARGQRSDGAPGCC
jgi:SAM-dependent methyltransferase